MILLNRFSVNCKRNTVLISFLFLLYAAIPLSSQSYNLGTGIYPGSPKENFAPSLKADKNNYRSIALFKPVYSSGSYDFYLTGQLITDGIVENKMPGWIVTTTSNEGIMPRNEREYFIDGHPNTRKNFDGNSFWIQTEFAGNYITPETDGFRLTGSISIDTSKKEIQPWTIIIKGSNDGKNWKVLSTLSDTSLLGDTLTGYKRTIYPKNYRVYDKSIQLDDNVNYKYYRAELSCPVIESWRVAEFQLTDEGRKCRLGGPYSFTSAWKSAGSKNEWIYVDLGAQCSFDKIKLFWLRRAAEGTIQVSDDAKNWKDISPLPSSSTLTDEIKFEKPIMGRYVKLDLKRAKSEVDGYVLNEMEVYGTGAAYAVAHPQAGIEKNGTLRLSGGDWKLRRSSLQLQRINDKDNMENMSKVGYKDSTWIVATVPGTVLTSYLNDGIIPDPDYVDNQFLISDSYFYANFIYRDEFTVPQSYSGKRVFLNFDGINYKALVFLNGKKLGRIEGAFTRGKFDVTDKIIPGKKNAVAVYIYKNDNPGYVKEPTFENHDVNGGELGLDNPTFHASVGWDWMPSIRGRNIGIWKDVYFTTSGEVTIEDPLITSRLNLPDTTAADVKIQVTLVNHKAENIGGKLKGEIGSIKFETPVSLLSSESKVVILDPAVIRSLHMINPKLWWPNGYGIQNLYNVKLEFVSSKGKVSDTKEFKTGIRELTYSKEDSALKIWVNGKRFIARGGNWGFSESNLRYRSREFDIAVRYQKEMNFNMLRNWVGQTGDDEFYDACDKYGIMVWQDFWLANPGDGPNPKDNKFFMQSAEDFIKKIRNHPSIGLYCGRNEGNPPDELEKQIRALLPQTAPGVRYITNSAEAIVSGHGPYNAMPTKYYFRERATPLFHSEIGLPNPVSFESIRKMMPDSLIWPINRMWGIHDFSLESAQEGAGYMKMMEDNFGKFDNAKDWLAYSQWITYQDYRAILEAQGKNRMGVLLWMSHPSWPSLVFQTYDYYFEPTAAYFGCKKGSEPLHIQYNEYTDSIEVVNYNCTSGNGLTASVEILNLDGSVKLEKQFTLDCTVDQVKRIYKIEKPENLSSVFFIRLKLKQAQNLISENFYWQGIEDGKLQAVRDLPRVKLDLSTKAVKKDGKWLLTTELSNNTKTPALMVYLKVVGEKNKERILPVIYSDNYVSLMPGEKRIIKIELENADTRGEKPVVDAEGVNIK
jgi:hypothetical protein